MRYISYIYYIYRFFIQFIDPFEDADINGPSHPDVVYNWLELKKYFFDIFLGKEHMMSRSASILHVLGSVTVSTIARIDYKYYQVLTIECQKYSEVKYY